MVDQMLLELFEFFSSDGWLPPTPMHLRLERSLFTLLPNQLAHHRSADRKPLANRFLATFATFVSGNDPLT